MENLVKNFDPFWKNKKVLITGHTGFKGAWLSFILKEFGANIYGISLKQKNQNSFFKKINCEIFLKKNYIIDITKQNKIKTVLRNINPEIIFHLAAQPIVKHSIEKPIDTLSTNIIGLSNVLFYSKDLKKLRSIIIVTSDKCYKDKGSIHYKENDELGGADPYSMSKACQELVTSSFAETYFKKKKILCCTVRAGNVIGGGDFAENRLIPDIARNLFLKKKFFIRNPSYVRPWQHVIEPLSGYIKLAKRLYQGIKTYQGSWNFAPEKDNCKSVADVIFYLQKKNFKLNCSKKKLKFKETKFLLLNNQKAKKKLKWRPLWNFETSIDKSIEWYKNYKNISELKKITKKQLYEYFKKRKNNFK